MADEKMLMVMLAVTDMAKAKAFYAEQCRTTQTRAAKHIGAQLHQTRHRTN